MKLHKERLDKILKLERRPVEIKPDEEYAEIGIYSYGKGIFHKTPRSAAEIGNKRLFYILEGDFILQNVFAWEGAVAIASSKENGFCGSHRFLTFRVNTDLCSPTYLRQYLLTKEGLEQLKKISPGSAGRNRTLNIKRLPEVLVPLPPRPIQDMIVEYLVNLQNSIHEIRTRLEVVPILLENTRISLLKMGSSGELTRDWRWDNPNVNPAIQMLDDIQNRKNQEFQNDNRNRDKKLKSLSLEDYAIVYERHPEINTWARAKLENLIYIAGRIGWKGLTADEYVDEGPLLLSVNNLRDWEYVKFDGANHITEDRYNESPEIQIQNDDILLVKDGSIGKIGFVQGIKKPATVNGSILVVRGLEAFDPKFLFYILSGPELQNIAKDKIRKGSTPHLFARDIKKFYISVPPKEEQVEIVKRLEALLTEIYDSYSAYEEMKSIAKNIQESIVSYAFSDKFIRDRNI